MMLRSRSGASRAIQRARRGGRFLDVCQRDGQVGLALERHAASGHLVQHGARARRRPTAASPAGRAPARAPGTAPSPSPRPVRVRPLDDIAWAMPKSVRRGRPSSPSKHVLRFDVAMDDAAPMRVLERGRQRGANGPNLVVGQRRGLANAVLQIAAVDQLHDDERRLRLGVFADVVDRARCSGGSAAPRRALRVGSVRGTRDRRRTAACSSLTATRRSSSVSCASQTTAMPPRAISRISR